MWLIYAILCAFLLSAASLVQKKTLIREHAMEFAATLAIITMILCLPFLFFIDLSQLNPRIIFIIYSASWLGSIGFLLVAKSVRHMEISEAAPLLVIGPAVSAILAFVLLGEKLTLLQMSGILILIIGSYILELKSNHDFSHPMRIFRQSRYSIFILFAVALYAVASIFDRVVLSQYSIQPLAYIAVVHIFIAINFLILISLFHDGIRGIRHGLQNTGVWLLLAGMLTVGYRLAQAQAVQAAYVGLVLPIKRMSAFFTTIIGGELYHEHNLFRKSIACAIMLGGVLMIVL